VLRCFSFGICKHLFRDLLTEKLNFIYVYETVDYRINLTRMQVFCIFECMEGESLILVQWLAVKIM